MLTKEEETFLQYWEQQRNSIHNQTFWHTLKGTPKFLKFSLIIPFIFLMYHKFDQSWLQARKQGQPGFENPYIDNPYFIFSILLGSIFIAIFVSYFTRQHKNEMNEQYYKELIIKKKQITP